MGIPTQIAAEKVFELVVEPVISCKKWAKRLEETASLLKPSIDEYIEIASNPNLSDLSAPRIQRYIEFEGLLQSAIDRARKAQQTNTLAVQEKFNDAKEIHEFLEKIDDFIRNDGPPNLALDSQQLRVDVRNLGRNCRKFKQFAVQEKFNDAKEIHELLEKIDDFNGNEGPPDLALDSQQLRVGVRNLGRTLKEMERLILQNISPTQTNIDGIHGAQAAERSNSINDAKEIHELLEKIDDFIGNEGPPNLALDSQQLGVDVRNLGRKLKQMERLILQNISPTQTNIDGIHGAQAAERSNSIYSQVPPKPEKALGLYERIDEVKQILNQRDVNIVGITGMAGSGKTTLASALCHDPGVKDTFQSNIHFISVSQFHGNENGVCEILEIMYHSIFGGEKPKFQSIEYGHNQLQNNLNRNAHPKTLVVLDDVWPGLSVKNLLFTAEGYKTIITTRHNSIIQYIHGSLYEIPVLNAADALSLFCFWAFGQASIPPTANGDLVREVAAECNGLPLALRMIGSSLHSAPLPIWEIVKEKLSKSETISTYHEAELFGCLKTSIDILSKRERQCFLDLGAFPEGRRFGVGSLLDIWTYVRKMTWLEAFDVLSELASRNLMRLTSEWSAAINYHCVSGLYFSQHDVMRDLALHLSNQDSNILCKRIFMPRKEANIPTEWLSAAQSSSAQFVSIHTGAMKEEDWGQINFPKVEALTLFFDAEQYCLPTFLQSMSNLKVLIVYNYSSQLVTLSGLPSFPSSVQIRSVLLYKLIVPSFYENCRSWERLEKLYICRCGDLGNITPVNKDKESEALNFPNLLEINVDECNQSRELPIKLSNITSLQMLSVTNCYLLNNLPVDLETLSSLRVLRLSGCTGLSRLPPSISKLAQLECFDISFCLDLRDLPAEFGHLPNLKMLDTTGCLSLKLKPGSLERVIIFDDEEES